MRISVKVETKQAIRELDRIQRRQVPFATATAINDTAFDTRKWLTRSMRRFMSNPRPRTLRGLRVVKATKQRLWASVEAVQWADEYFRYLVFGGVEAPKRRTHAVPVAKNRINQYGNLRGKRQGIKKGKDFYDETDAGKPGVFREQGRGKARKRRLQVILTGPLAYRKQWPYVELANRYVRRVYKRHFEKALNRALRTAR